MSETAGASPPKDQDIFGNELGLTGGERQILSQAGHIFLKKVLQVDSHSKKGDPTEPKTLVISTSRCYVLSAGASPKMEASFNFLRIKHLECSDKKLTFHLASDPRPRMFHSARADSIQIIGLITAQLKNVFPITQLDLIIKTTFDTDSLCSAVSGLRDNLLGAMDRVDASSISGFLTSYGFLCDFFGVPFNHEIAWYLKNVYLAHGFRDLKLTDLDHLPQRDILPVISTLRHNEFFEGVVDRSDKMGPDFIEELSFVLNTSQSVKKLELIDCTLKPENLVRLSIALKHNAKSVLTHLDLSDNMIDDKSMESFGAALEALPHGLHHLKLANCKITTRGGSLLANSMKQNKNMQYTLVHFDLSANPLGPDPLGALAFIQEPQTIATLNLSQCNLNFEFVVPVLNRGCQQHLRDLDLSGNAGKGKKGVHGPSVGAGLQQFVSSAIAIHSVNLSNCKLQGDVISSLLEGLSVNPNVTGVNLDVSNNELGVSRDPQHLPKVLSRTKCLRQLNISCCGLDNGMPDFAAAIAANDTLKHVFIGRNFNSKPQVRVAALKCLVMLLQREDCHLQSLCVEDSKLKEQTSVILNALDENNSLRKLNISGNQMGDHGARSLAKTLLTNTCLSEVEWDRNEVGVQGFNDVAAAMEHNYTLQVMPLPLYDVSKAGKVEDTVQRIQLYLCRNHSDERLKVELAARHRNRLLTATQQSSVVSRELAQLEDLLEWAVGCHGNEHQDVTTGQQMKEQAYRVQKVTDGLYSPQVESEQFESITAQVKHLIDSFMDKMFVEQVVETSEQMVTRSMKACPNLLSQQSQEQLRGLVMHEQDKDYQYVKKAVAKKTAPEIINHISAINLDTAANISELLVEQTLAKLDQANHKLLKLKKAARSNNQTPDTKVSRNFTFRVQEDQSPTKKKKRVRRPDSDDEEIDLPSIPLTTEGPPLQHLGKTRPKPARLQQSTKRRPQRPTVKPSPAAAIEEEPTTTPAAVDKPPEPQPKPKAKPLLPKQKSTEETIKLVKYEEKPEEGVKDIKTEKTEVEPPKPEKQDKLGEQVKLDEHIKQAKRKEEDLKLEELTLELELRAKETKLSELEAVEPKQSEAVTEPGNSEPGTAPTTSTEEHVENGRVTKEAEKLSPSPVGVESNSDGDRHNKDKSSEVSESQSSKVSMAIPDFEQILAGTSWSSEPAPSSPEAALEEMQAIEKTMEQLEADLSGLDVEESSEVKDKEPNTPAKLEKPSVGSEESVSPAKTKAEVVANPPQTEVKGESGVPKEEVKFPKVSPKPTLKYRVADLPASEPGAGRDNVASPEVPPSAEEREKNTPTPDKGKTTPTPDKGKTTPTPDRGKTTPTPDKEKTAPIPDREKATPTPDREKIAKETPPAAPRKPKTKTPPISPRSSVSVNLEARKSGISKLFGPKKNEGEGEEKSSRLSQTSDRGLSGEWELIEPPDNPRSSSEVAKKPPPVASKPKPSAGESSPAVSGGGGDARNQPSPKTSPKKMPGVVAAASVSELANVLKSVPMKSPAAKDQPSPTHTKKSTPAPAPKPRPKPRPAKRGSAGDILDRSSSIDEPETNGTLV